LRMLVTALLRMLVTALLRMLVTALLRMLVTALWRLLGVSALWRLLLISALRSRRRLRHAFSLARCSAVPAGFGVTHPTLELPDGTA
jgi:hypothetical protein